MKKHVIIIAVLLIIIALAVYGLTRIEKYQLDTNPPATTTPTVTTSSTPTVEIKSMSTSSPLIRVVIEYPQFAGDHYKKLNAAIKKSAEDIYKNNVDELTADVEGIVLNVDMGDQELVIERKVDTEKTYINATTGVASFAFSNYANTGGAHPTFFYTSATYDLQTGNVLALKDLFKGGYEPFLSQYLKDQIVNAKANDENCRRCDVLEGNVEIENAILVDVFSLNADGIIFLYGAYDLGSYAATSAGQEIFVPKEKLGEFIQREG